MTCLLRSSLNSEKYKEVQNERKDTLKTQRRHFKTYLLLNFNYIAEKALESDSAFLTDLRNGKGIDAKIPRIENIVYDSRKKIPAPLTLNVQVYCYKL